MEVRLSRGCLFSLLLVLVAGCSSGSESDDDDDDDDDDDAAQILFEDTFEGGLAGWAVLDGAPVITNTSGNPAPSVFANPSGALGRLRAVQTFDADDHYVFRIDVRTPPPDSGQTLWSVSAIDPGDPQSSSFNIAGAVGAVTTQVTFQSAGCQDVPFQVPTDDAFHRFEIEFDATDGRHTLRRDGAVQASCAGTASSGPAMRILLAGGTQGAPTPPVLFDEIVVTR